MLAVRRGAPRARPPRLRRSRRCDGVNARIGWDWSGSWPRRSGTERWWPATRSCSLRDTRGAAGVGWRHSRRGPSLRTSPASSGRASTGRGSGHGGEDDGMDHRDHVALIRAGVEGAGRRWLELGAGEGAFTLALADLLGPGAAIT